MNALWQYEILDSDDFKRHYEWDTMNALWQYEILDSDDFKRQGVMIYENVGNFMPFCNVCWLFLKNRSIDFEQNHSECKT